MPPRTLRIDVPTRLDKLIAESLDTSRIEANRLLASGVVTVNGRKCGEKHKGLKLSPGDRVTVGEFVRPEDRLVVPQPELPLDVLAHGEGWIIVNKPAAMPVHPLETGETGTVLNAVVAKYPQVQGVGEAGLRSGVVHRLDVETSGTLMFATDEDAWARYRGAFEEHKTKKIYQAIVEGKLVGNGRERVNLTVAQHRPARVAVVDAAVDRKADAKGAVRACTLSWRAVEALRGATLIEVDLETGFLHQIRATFAHAGHCVAGDKLYGSTLEAPRPMLHASRLCVLDKSAEAPLPDDMRSMLSSLRRA